MGTNTEIADGLLRLAMTPADAGARARERIASMQRARSEGGPIDACDIGASDAFATVDAPTTTPAAGV